MEWSSATDATGASERRGRVVSAPARSVGSMTEKPPLALDPADPVHAEVLARLASDHIGWLTTVRADGSPHAVPVWFLWHDGRLLVMSEPRTAKVTNVRRGSPALLHLHTRADGNGVVVLSGPARDQRPHRRRVASRDRRGVHGQVRRGDGGLRHGAGGHRREVLRRHRARAHRPRWRGEASRPGPARASSSRSRRCCAGRRRGARSMRRAPAARSDSPHAHA